jgi:hypothetical protein
MGVAIFMKSFKTAVCHHDATVQTLTSTCFGKEWQLHQVADNQSAQPNSGSVLSNNINEYYFRQFEPKVRPNLNWSTIDFHTGLTRLPLFDYNA